MSDSKEHQGTTGAKYLNPILPPDLEVHDVPIVLANDATLKDVGCLVRNPEDFTIENDRFEIVPWPQPGWRSLDPGTGVEGGTTEGEFQLSWENGLLIGENSALSTSANKYVLAFESLPVKGSGPGETGSHVFVWYSDYHPDVGQLNELFQDVESRIQHLLAGKIGPSHLMSELLTLIELANSAIVIFEHYTPANGGMPEQFVATMRSSGFKVNNDVGRVSLPDKLHNASGEVLELWLTEQSECIEVFELIRLIPFSARARLERQSDNQESGSKPSGLIIPDPVVAKPVLESEHRSQQQQAARR